MPVTALPPWKDVVGKKSRCCACAFVTVWMIFITVNFFVHTGNVLAALDNAQAPTTSMTIDGNEKNDQGLSNWGRLPNGIWLEFDCQMPSALFCDKATNYRITTADHKVGEPGDVQPYTGTGKSGVVFNTSNYYPIFDATVDSDFPPTYKMQMIPAFCVLAALEENKVVTAKYGTVSANGTFLYQGVFTIDTNYHVAQSITIKKEYVPRQGDTYWGLPWDKDEHTVPKFSASVSNRLLYNDKYTGVVEFWFVIESPTVSHVTPLSVYSRLTTVYGQMGGWLSWCFFAFSLMFVKLNPNRDAHEQLTTRFCRKRPEDAEAALTSIA